MDNLGREDEYKEFKESTSELDKGLISLTAMLNKHCSGQLFFGVKDNGDIIGQDIGKTTLKTITQAVNNFIDPTITPEVEVLNSSDGRQYISVTVEGHDRPYTFKGMVYIRSGEEDRKALNSDLRKMVLSSGDLLRDTKSNEQELTFKQLSSMLKEKGFSVRKDKSFLSSLGLSNKEGTFNIQAELLSDQNRQPLTIAVFSGLDRSRLSFRKDYSGKCLPMEINETLDYMESINEKAVDVSGPKRVETDMFYYSAFKEAWINACVHNNWIGQIPPAIHIFDDRIEIISYGDIPYWLSKESFFAGESMPVNESLMRVFISVGLCEHTGHGIPLITKHYGKDAYRFTGSSVIVTLTFLKKRISSRYRNTAEIAKLRDNELLVLTALKEHPDYSLDKIAALTGVGRSTIGNMIPRLRKAGLLERNGSLRDGIWIVKADLD